VSPELAANGKNHRLLPIAHGRKLANMTKQKHTPHSSGESLQPDQVTLLLESLVELVEKVRLEILAEVLDVKDDVRIIAAQIKRSIKANEQ